MNANEREGVGISFVKIRVDSRIENGRSRHLRKPIVAANWKMFKTIAEARKFVREFAPMVSNVNDVDIVLCPPFTALAAVGDAVKGSNVRLGAQDIFWKEQGAYTGEISPLMLKDVGCDYVIVGHSERRGRFGKAEFDADLLTVFGDNDATVNTKAQAALAHGLTPILCVGETIAERRAGDTDAVVRGQVKAALNGLNQQNIVFAYEPVWAIGTGEVCGASEANRVIALIRTTIGEVLGGDAAAAIRIQYGGSVKPDNIAELIGQSDIDGALVGGASLEAKSFAAIVQACSQQ
jgi:triosephosphate isomerase